MSEYSISSEPAIAAVTANASVDMYDADASKRVKQATAAQIAAYVRSTIEGNTEVNTAISTVGAGTLTAAGLVGAIITRSGPTANYTDTTDTAANIIAALPAAAAVGYSWEVTIINTVQFQETLAAGAGVTLSGVQQIGANCIGRFLLTYSGAGAVTMYGLWIADRGIDNFNASADPAAGNDNTQGYGVGSIWFNGTAGQLRWWECRDASTGAAKWVFSGADYANGGTTPSNEQTAFGAGTGAMNAEGNANRQISVAGINPGATGADNVLAVFSIPASSFDVAGRGIVVTAFGNWAANTNSKEVKLIFNPSTAVVGSTVGAGGSTLADTGAQTTNGNNVGWQVTAQIFKGGAGGSNTQVAQGSAIYGATHGGVTKALFPTATESGAILVAVTGNAATAVGDISLNFFEVNAMN